MANLLSIGTDVAGNQLGFHPSLTHIKALFDQRKVGVIQAVGYPNPNYSHFSSMDKPLQTSSCETALVQFRRNSLAILTARSPSRWRPQHGPDISAALH